MTRFEISYGDLVNVILNNDRDIDKCINNIKTCYHVDDILEEIRYKLTKSFFPNFEKRWHTGGRNKKFFFYKI